VPYFSFHSLPGGERKSSLISVNPVRYLVEANQTVLPGIFQLEKEIIAPEEVRHCFTSSHVLLCRQLHCVGAFETKCNAMPWKATQNLEMRDRNGLQKRIKKIKIQTETSENMELVPVQKIKQEEEVKN
jgi:hypothetical protein